MDAIISGRAGVAFLVEGEAFSSFDVEDPATLLPRRPTDLRLLFGEAPDVEFFEDVDHDAAARHLERAFNCASALDLALILFDPELTDDLRDDAAEELERLLSERPVADYLENVLHGRPLPAAADLLGALARGAGGRLPKLSSLLQILEGYQPSIRAVRAAWDNLPANLFGDDERKADFQHAAVREGLFRQLAAEVANGPRARLGDFILRSGINRSITSLRNHRDVIKQWTTPFRSHIAAPRITHEGEDFLDEASPTRKGRRKRGRRESAEDKLNKLQGQRDLIVTAMRQHNLPLARKITDEVIDYQLKTTKSIRAAKTLCSLATEAKALDLYSLQLELTEWAIQIVPDDGWSWTQYADALLKLHKPNEALKAYEQAESFGAGVVAKNGRAETLRALGRLPEALAAYDSAIAQHPENVVAKRGRAEALKALGRLDDTLAAYDSVLADNPENAIIRTGRSCVLVALRRYDEALQLLPETPVTLRDWIGYHVRGMILLRMGKVDEAVRIFEHGVRENPIPSSREYFRNALALACLRRGDYTRAGSSLEGVTTSLLQPQANVLRLHAYGASGDEARAAKAFEALRDKPWSIPDELIAELHRKYLLKEEPRHDDDWVIERESDMFLFDPNQQILSYASLPA